MATLRAAMSGCWRTFKTLLSPHRRWDESTDRDFLILWKDADPDIPILGQAKAEYAKLQ